MDQPAGRVGSADGTVVAQQGQRKQGFLERVAVRGAARQQRRGLGIEDDKSASSPGTKLPIVPSSCMLRAAPSVAR